jgi:L-lactate utilization protein LutB
MKRIEVYDEAGNHVYTAATREKAEEYIDHVDSEVAYQYQIIEVPKTPSLSYLP